MMQDEQRGIVTAAKVKLLQWAFGKGIPLHRVEFVFALVPSGSSLSAWLSFETDEQLQRAQRAEWTGQLAARFKHILRELGYDPSAVIHFRFDSHETVAREYEGSYFYRLR